MNMAVKTLQQDKHADITGTIPANNPVPQGPQTPSSPKRQKKKTASRPPVCTFFNYLPKEEPPKPPANHTGTQDIAAITKDASPVAMEGVVALTDGSPVATATTTTPTKGASQDEKVEFSPDLRRCQGGKGTTATTSNTADMTLEDDDIIVNNNSNDDNANTANTGDDDDMVSVETVNTSNKSVDIYLRHSPDRPPAFDRWEAPPAPRTNHNSRTDRVLASGVARMDLNHSYYVTSRCESDDEEDEYDDEAVRRRPTTEISFRKRGRCPRLQQQTRWKQHTAANISTAPSSLLKIKLTSSSTSTNSSTSSGKSARSYKK